MSRAILTVVLARTLHRQPSDAELTEFLAHLRDLAGERIYIPQAVGITAESAQRIRAMHSGGMSIRRIAREERISKSQVHRALSQNPDLFVDSKAA